MTVSTIIHEHDDALTFERVQDVEPIMKFAHNQRVNGDVGSSEMRHAASLPMVVVEAYCNDKGITFHEFMNDPRHAKSMLNAPELRAFRIWEGRA